MQRRHAMPFGAEVLDEGVRFRFWAPTAREVALVLEGAEQPMPEVGQGWRELVVPQARAGQRYGYRIDRELVVPDPASRFQPEDVHKPSLIVDPRGYEWRDEAWRGRPWEEAVLYELHVGTVTPEGTYAGLMGRLEQLRDLGVTAIELLPLSDFPGARNWGYDGVLHYAPDGAYGTPDDLKRLIDRAHALGLMMLIDVVYNHFGPTGNYLNAYAKTFFTERHQTPWGAGINFDGESAPAVRDFFVHNALYWLEEFHADGLRFDAVHAIADDSETHILEELGTRVRAALPGREIHLVLENDANQARFLPRDRAGRPPLYTAQWNDDIHHCWHVLITGEREGYYEAYADDPVRRLGRCLAEGYAYQGETFVTSGEARGEASGHLPPAAFIAFLQNHDQIGNRAFGERLSDLAPRERLSLARALFLLSPQPPMLYMGEEWAASTPFLYFVDFAADEALSTAVREGRRREFGRFAAFKDPAVAATIPDPTDEATFRRSVLNWDERETGAHAEVLRETRDLLALRRETIVPLIATPFIEARSEQPGPGALTTTWTFEGGMLHFLANFGEGSASLAMPRGARVLWCSPGTSAEGKAELPSWTGAVLTSARP